MLNKLLFVLCINLLSFAVLADCPAFTASFTSSSTNICGAAPQILTLTNTTSGTIPNPIDFEWFVDGVSFGSTSNVGTPASVTVAGVGTHNIMLIATDPVIGCGDTVVVSVNVFPTPNAGFTFNPVSACAFDPVSFTNTSTGTFGGTTYNWNFGDGATSTSQNPSHAYTAPGTYNVTLTQTNGPGCTSTFNTSVTIIDAPVPLITGDDGDGDVVYCLFPGDNTTSETVTFSNFTTGGVSYEWDFDDGSPIFTTGSTADITHTYTSYGTYNVTMTATGPNGCQTSTTIEVIFEKFVSAALTLDVTEYSGCAPHDMSTLTNLSVNATNFQWNFGDGSTFNTNDPTPPSYAYTTPGSYTVTLTASNSCNTATATISPIIIIGGPTANFTSSVNTGCAPQNVTFTNSSTNTQPANNYQWTMGNGNSYTTTITPPAQVYPNSGTYTVQLVAGNACGTDTIVRTIVIDTIPTVDLVLDPITGCTPLNVNPTATLLSGNNVNWAWYVDGVYYSAAPNDIPNQNFISLNPNDSTLHTIQVNVSNACGSDSEIDQVYVHPPVIAQFTTQDTLCIGQTSTFNNASTGTELQYSWDFGDGSPIDNSLSPSHHFAASGSYLVTLTTTGVCGTDIETFTVVIIDYPTINITPSTFGLCEGEALSFTNSSSVEGTYNWQFGPGSTPTTSNLYNPGTINLVGSGTHEISFTVNYSGCVSSDTIEVEVSEIPIVAINFDATTGCSPFSPIITNNSVDSVAYNYDWNYGNGATSNGYDAVPQTYLSGLGDSTYTIQLIVETPSGCSDSVEQQITVHPLPFADFTVLDDTICQNESMLFANNSIGASTYNWNFGDGNTSIQTSPLHNYTSTGDFSVELIAISSFGCADTANLDIFIDSIPQPAFTSSVECLGGTTVFTNNSTGSPTSFEWDFGDGSPTETSENPTHLYASSGTFLVQLTVSNSVNCSNTLAQLVQVNQVPVPEFNWSQTCMGDAMQFTDQTLNSPVGWAWDFGDGNNSNVQNPAHVYADTGSYTVQLIVSGGSGCLDSIEHVVYVDSIPTADFSFLQACTNETTSFTDLSTIDPDVFFWTFGDGTNSSLQNPTHTYLNSGTYNVSLTVTYSSNSCSNTINQLVEAYPRTTPAFTANTPCLGEITSFVDQTGGAPNQWEWDFGDGSPIETTSNPTHLYASQGLFDITLITENAFGCSDTLYQQIEIYGLPVANFTSGAVCLGANSLFTDNSTDDVNWEWDFGDGTGSNLENPTHAYGNFGDFTVQLIAFNAFGCSDTITDLVTVYPNPTAAFDVDIACFGYETSFTDNSIDAVSWTWDFGDGTGSNLSDPSTIYGSDGTFNAEQLVTNVFGCSDSLTQVVTVYPQPISGFTNNTVCAQDVVQFSDTTVGAPVSWEWDFGDGSAADFTQNPIHIFDLGGLYDVTLITANGIGCHDTTIVSIEVYTNPVALFEADTVCYLDITHFSDLSTDVVPIVSWEWDFGDNINTSTLQNPTYIYQSPGVYPAVLTIENIHGCDSTFSINVHVNNIPTAEFTFDTVCWGSPTNFSDVSLGSVATWSWDFGDGSTSNLGPNVQHTYPNPGSYLASMEVDGGVGCTDIIYHAIQVLDVLTPVIGVPNTACLNQAINFTDQSVASGATITGWNWDFGDGIGSTLQNPTHAYGTAGVYTVTLNVSTSTGCTNTATFDITIFDPPVADFTFTIPCEGQETLFTDASSDPNGTINAWSWNFGDGSPLDFTQSPAHLYAVAGNYNVNLQVTSSTGCSASLAQTVTIYPAPTASFISGLECGGEPVDLISTSVGNIVDYEWIYNGSTISNAATTSYIFPTDSDTHPVTLVVTTDLGCIDSLTQDVITKAVVFFDYGPFETAGCPVMEAHFYDNSTTSSGSSTVINWLWDMGDGSYSFAQNPTHYYENSGTYTVSLQVITSDDCIYSDTLTYSIIVYPQPTAGFLTDPDSINIMNPVVNFTDQSLGATDIEWHFGDFEYSNDWNPTHEYADTGYFTIEQFVYNEYGCVDTAYKSIYIHGNHFIYVPNAFTPDGNQHNQLFNIKSFGLKSYELYIFNRWGEIVYTIHKDDPGWDGTYLGRDCPNDVYTWKLNALDYDGIQHERTGHVSLIRQY